MIDYLSQNMWLLWTVIMFVCLIIELSSGDFYVTCFAIGALITVPAAALEVPLWMQVLVWAVASVLSILLVRPQLVKHLHKPGRKLVTNADAIIGRRGIVIEPIEASKPGYVKIDGDEWRAVGDGGLTFEKGDEVTVVARDSVIVTVR